MACPLSRLGVLDGPEAGRRVVELGQGDPAGALELDDPVGAQQLLEVVELGGVARRATR